MLRRAIEAALPFVDQGLTNQPLIEARLRMTVGWSFWCLGEPGIAAEQFQAARTLYSRHRGADHADTLMSMNNLANSYSDLGRHAESLKLHEETLALRKAKLGRDHPDTLMSMNNVAFGYANAKRLDEAIQLARETLALRKTLLGLDHPHTLMSMMVLSRSYLLSGRRTEALQLGEETFALQKAKLGPDDPFTLRTMHNLAISYANLGRHTEALKLQEEALPLMRAKIGPDHFVTLASITALARSYATFARDSDAAKLHEETLALRKAKFGKDHPYTLASMQELAWLLATCPDAEFRDASRAVELARGAAELAPTEGKYWNTLGVAHYRDGGWKAAIAAFDKSMELRSGGDGFDWFFLAMAEWQLGNQHAARQWYEKAVERMEKKGSTHEELNRFRNEAADLLGVTEKR